MELLWMNATDVKALQIKVLAIILITVSKKVVKQHFKRNLKLDKRTKNAVQFAFSQYEYREINEWKWMIQKNNVIMNYN